MAVDCDLCSDPRIIEAGRDAKDLFVAALCYCGKHDTDGRVNVKTLARLAVDAMMTEPAAIEAAAALVGQGLWTDTPTGWVVTRYLSWQRSRSNAEAAEERVTKKRANNRERQARWKASEDVDPLTSENVDRAAARNGPGNALPNASADVSRNAQEKKREEVKRSMSRKADRPPVTGDAKRLAQLLLDRYFELKPNSTRVEVSNASKRGIQDLLDLGPPGAKQGIPVERVEHMIELLHTRGREPWPGKGTCWAEQVRSGEKLREKWTDFEGKWMNEQMPDRDKRPANGSYVRAGLSFAEQSKQGGNT